MVYDFCEIKGEPRLYGEGRRPRIKDRGMLRGDAYDIAKCGTPVLARFLRGEARSTNESLDGVATEQEEGGLPEKLTSD